MTTQPHIERWRTFVVAFLLVMASVGSAGGLLFPFLETGLVINLTADDYKGLVGEVITKVETEIKAMPDPEGWDCFWHPIDCARQSVEKQTATEMVKRAKFRNDNLFTPEVVAQYNRKLENLIVDKGQIPVGKQYLLNIIRALYDSREYGLAIAVALFSVVFPVLKILLCIVILATFVFRVRGGQRLARFVKDYSSWSMADVFLSALVIVYFKAPGFHFEFESGLGLYCYFGAFLASAAAARLLARVIPAVSAEPVVSLNVA